MTLLIASAAKLSPFRMSCGIGRGLVRGRCRAPCASARNARAAPTRSRCPPPLIRRGIVSRAATNICDGAHTLSGLSAIQVAFGIGVPERRAEAWLVRVGRQAPAVRVQGAVEEHPLDPLVVVKVLDVPQVGHGNADACVQVLALLRQTFPADVEYKVPFEAVTVVKVSMSDVVWTLLKTLGLVAVVVFLFLQNLRSTLIPVLAIPVSILGTFCFFIPLGFTINTLTMFGFVLAIGIVVDDAIIVVEAVQHYIDEQKMSAKEATYHAMKDISGPVVAIALILAAVFVPVGFIPGIVGRLYQQFAITIAISVILSAFIALSLTPALCTLLLKPTDEEKESRGINKFFFRFNNWFDRVTDKYTNGVKKSISASRYIVILLLCICVGAYFLFQQKPSGFIPSEDDGNLYVTFQLPPASSTAQSVDLMTRLMKVVASTPGVGHYAALSGLNVLNNASNSNAGTIYVQLKPWDERSEPDQKVPGIMQVMQKRIAEAGIKNANVEVIQPSPIPGVGQTVGFSFQIEQRNTNDDLHAFENVVKNFVTEANKNPAITGAFSFYSAHTPGINLTVDREKCEKTGCKYE